MIEGTPNESVSDVLLTRRGCEGLGCVAENCGFDTDEITPMRLWGKLVVFICRMCCRS
jgi:hypothetical protein